MEPVAGTLVLPLRPGWAWRALAAVLAFLAVLFAAVGIAATIAFSFTSGFAGIFTLACALVPGLFLIVRIKRPIERGLGRRWNRVTLEPDGTLTLRVGRSRPRVRLRTAEVTRCEHGRWDVQTTTTVNHRRMDVTVRLAYLLLADADRTVVLLADDWGGEGASTAWPRREPPDAPPPLARIYAADLVRLTDAVRAALPAPPPTRT